MRKHGHGMVAAQRILQERFNNENVIVVHLDTENDRRSTKEGVIIGMSSANKPIESCSYVNKNQ
ncbi:hypothetical protein HZI73_26220 (plasmid) [Vallitalea pronyensis]|uniref:Uncharacterized protein n=1 Tax=Vallitalea pronyensis TaxID=1348613 RepID=A0A8J8MQX7_9FIRM|nr:hypothetical protein [Vallitalea pronyensis]QUI25911.1 hypothetical protein HZI73_26220 [Vallitalea pronyensis]